jgi:choline-sulfatase
VTRRDILGLLAAGVPATTKDRQRPNVVMFMTDDHGAWATGAYGCRGMHTPNIDSLARGGLRFTNAFASTPVCSPSRMTWLTGRLPSTHGVQDWLVPADCSGKTSRRWLKGQPTYSEILARTGYVLGMCGKWHMGDDDVAQAGFTYWATVPGGGGTYRSPTFVHNGSPEKVDKFKTDAVADFAIDFLNRQTGEHPFYLLVPFYAPHTPYDYQPDEYQRPYLDSEFQCFPNVPQSPWQNENLKGMHGKRQAKLAYSALITGVDTNVGRILKRLEELKLRDNTLVIFTADQRETVRSHSTCMKSLSACP